MVTLVIILSLLVVILGYTTFNLLHKVEILEGDNNIFNTLYEEVGALIDFSDKKLKEIDAKGTFQSDDEVGFFFKEIKVLQKMFNDFKK